MNMSDDHCEEIQIDAIETIAKLTEYYDLSTDTVRRVLENMIAKGSYFGGSATSITNLARRNLIPKDRVEQVLKAMLKDLGAFADAVRSLGDSNIVTDMIEELVRRNLASLHRSKSKTRKLLIG